jgi:type VI secretion system secreted protein VgrG
VLEEALGDYGRKVTVKTSKEYQELEYCTQFDETDLDFVQRLMATEGIMSYFVQGEKAEELVLFDDADKYLELLTVNHGKVPFETNMQQEHSVETVRRFAKDTRLTSTTATVRALNWSLTDAPQETSSQSKDALKRERELYLGEAAVSLRALRDDGVYAKTSAEGRVKLVKEMALSRAHVLAGEGDVSGLSPGVTFDLENALREELNRKYLVTQATHRGVRPGDRQQGTFNGEVGEVMYTNTFQCVASDVLFRPQTPSRRFVQTMQTATVVGDEDITTDVHGRIKVQFHWDRQGKKNIKSSCWVRVAQASAGIGFGCVFIPRKGQEVVVSFLEGDPDKPLVIGSVYNGINWPPYALPDEKTRSVIRTRSTPDGDGYNEISFEDAKDSEELYVQAQKDMKELVKHDHEVVIKNDETLTVEKNQSEGIGVDQTLSVGGNRSRSVTKNEDLRVGGNRSLSVGKNETISVDGSHSTTVSKSVTQSYLADHTRSTSGNQTFSVDKDKKEQIQGKLEVSVGKNRIDVVQGALTITVEKAHNEQCDDNRKSEVSKEYQIKANKLTINVEDEVSIKVGDTSMVLKKDSVVVKSPKATVNASGSVVVKGSKVGLN